MSCSGDLLAVIGRRPSNEVLVVAPRVVWTPEIERGARGAEQRLRIVRADRQRGAVALERLIWLPRGQQSRRELVVRLSVARVALERVLEMRLGRWLVAAAV